eukprot:2682130-Rhodomonas_salina.2
MQTHALTEPHTDRYRCYSHTRHQTPDTRHQTPDKTRTDTQSKTHQDRERERERQRERETERGTHLPPGAEQATCKPGGALAA